MGRATRHRAAETYQRSPEGPRIGYMVSIGVSAKDRHREVLRVLPVDTRAIRVDMGLR